MIDKQVLQKLYGESEDSYKRYNDLASRFKHYYHKDDGHFFSSPGRLELIGNHTDHNGGLVIASSIAKDVVAIASPNKKSEIHIISDDYRELTISLNKLENYKNSKGTVALVSGLIDGAKKMGYSVEGFDTCITSDVLSGSGLSSSAAFSMAILSIIDWFFNSTSMTYQDYAKIGQYAENVFWSKASGMLDQMACCIGGPILLDFKDANKPSYEKLDFDFASFGYDLYIIDTGEGHGGLNKEYSAIPKEMEMVAKALGVKRLCDSDINALLKKLNDISSDRAKLRAMHFFEENERVKKVKEAMMNKDIDVLLKLIDASGRSSFELLQNCFVTSDVTSQKVALALALINRFIHEVGRGASRVHGGGFKGTVLAIIAKEDGERFCAFMSNFFPKEAITPISLRASGTIHVF